MRFDQNQTPVFKIRHCTAQECNVRSSISTNKKIEKNPDQLGETAQMSEVVYGMQAQNNLASDCKCRDFPAWSFAAWSLERRPKQKSAASYGRRAVVRLWA